MIVYHGSYINILSPDIRHSRKRLDFGKGFYVTPDYSQAVRWVQKYKIQHLPGIVNQYELNEGYRQKYRQKIFAEYNEEWLEFIVKNRQGMDGCPKYDVICGGIANDRVFNTIELYQDGLISRQEALGKLRYYRPNYQICITSQNLLDEYLIFQCYKEV